MRNAAAKVIFIIPTFNVTFINKSHGDIKGRWIIQNQTQAQSECLVLRWISIFSKSSWIKATVSGLSYELGVDGEKKLMETGIFINKSGDNTFHTGKPGNLNSSREVIWIKYGTVTMKLIEYEGQC